MFGHLLKRGAVVLCLAAVLALPVCAEGRITTDMTMKEIRSDPAIAGSGVSTYCKGDADSLALRRLYENKTLLDYVGETTAQDSADGLNIVIENYEAGKQVTWQVYSPEEIAANSSLGCVQLYYFPGKEPGGKYALVVPGNGSTMTSEMEEGGSAAYQLHEQGYTVFVLRYRSFLNASDNAPLYDIANAVKYLTKNAEQFGVQRENYALMGFSSGGHIVGLIGSDNERFGYKAFGIPQPAALLLGYPINDFYEVKPLYHIAIDPLMISWRYYWTNISDVVNKNYTPTFFWYGKNDYYMECMNYEKQGPLLEKTLKESGATYQCVVYEDAPHAIGPGRHTDADGWIKLATEFWEEQCK